MRRLLAVGALGLMGLGLATTGAGWSVCHEDEACWDCATMGNRVCGTETMITEVAR